MFEMKLGHRNAMAFHIYCMVGVIILPFSLLAIWRENYTLGAAPLLTAFISLINVYSYLHFKRFWLPPTLLSLLYTLDNMIVVYTLGPMGAYWAFPTLLALFWVHERKVAINLCAIFYLAVCITAYFSFPLEATLRLAATLLMTAGFFNIAAKFVEKQYAELETLTITDHLTGAYNRRYMDRKLDELIARHARNGEVSSIIALDVDHFKKINDQFGHSVGDAVLVEMIKVLNSRVRSLDSVCRAGGEEFIVILPNTQESEARLLGEELRQTIASVTFLTEFSVTISCGVCQIHPRENRDAWLRRADDALYFAKQNGRNNVATPSSCSHLATA